MLPCCLVPDLLLVTWLSLCLALWILFADRRPRRLLQYSSALPHLAPSCWPCLAIKACTWIRTPLVLSAALQRGDGEILIIWISFNDRIKVRLSIIFIKQMSSVASLQLDMNIEHALQIRFYILYNLSQLRWEVPQISCSDCTDTASERFLKRFKASGSHPWHDQKCSFKWLLMTGAHRR